MIRMKIGSVLVLSALLLFAGCGQIAEVKDNDNKEESSAVTETETKEPATDTEDLSAQVQELVNSMTLYEKCSQLVIVDPEHFTGESPLTSADATLQTQLASMPVGGILFSEKNFIDKQQVATMLATAQSYSKIPLLLTCDEEGGSVNRLMNSVGTTYIGPMLGYADQGKDVAYSNAWTIASDMAALGFNADMAPVADVWSNPQNTVIGDRAYSTDFNQASELVGAAVYGFHDGGVATAIKHFPGHGDSSTDSHVGSVTVTKTLDQMRAQEFLPFQAGIAAGSDMVMVGHITAPNIDSAPATFSYKIVTEILRGELGFNGVVITDGLQMGAISAYGSGTIAVNAINAGCDLLLCPENPWEAITTLQNAVTSGSISEARINESVTRILTMKAQRGILQLDAAE